MTKLKELGMLDTSFVEPTGLSSQNVSTAYDVALLLDTAWEHELVKEATQLEEYYFSPVDNSRRLRSYTTDELLPTFVNKDPFKIELAKTGYIEESGYCFSAVINNTEENGRVIAVVLNSNANEARFQDLKSLVSWGFDTYDWR